ncbi:23S rRNA pseudouridine2605 synthase [Roseivivax lentus]|uniref:Pseudouridine synthase n=1 Tax=Roseivivax lentus TaxID=633194 RepID=A0A1N7M8C0_9RHOB|nr:pseudouridine synthase [Roseivivax lentus]SIS82221.1 23S rRNA pseudouridine2605 synthase [Roseivivax lentus]
MSDTSPPGDRIAKVLARAGLASRREAERMILEGRVAVNGTVIDRAALNVTSADKITVDGRPLDAPEPPRLWLYHKPTGLVTTTKDEQGRATIFDDLPEDMPRVMSVGRLDLNSEGLLLLTNDGGIKRRLELPSTGWLRRYRVRINGRPTDATFEPLRKGLEVDGRRFQPMIVTLDRQQGANAWVTVGLREGKNREIRRAMEDLGLKVNRLIRISYGPFQLGQLKLGAVEEIRPRILRDQLGLEKEEPAAPAPKKPGPPRKGKSGGKFGGPGQPGKPGPAAPAGARKTRVRGGKRAAPKR